MSLRGPLQVELHLHSDREVAAMNQKKDEEDQRSSLCPQSHSRLQWKHQILTFDLKMSASAKQNAAVSGESPVAQSVEAVSGVAHSAEFQALSAMIESAAMGPD